MFKTLPNHGTVVSRISLLDPTTGVREIWTGYSDLTLTDELQYPSGENYFEIQNPDGSGVGTDVFPNGTGTVTTFGPNRVVISVAPFTTS